MDREGERVRLCERVNIKLNGFYEIEQTIEWFSHDDISAKSNTRIEFRFLSYSQRYWGLFSHRNRRSLKYGIGGE